MFRALQHELQTLSESVLEAYNVLPYIVAMMRKAIMGNELHL